VKVRWYDGGGQWRRSRARTIDGAARAFASATDGRPEADGGWQLIDCVEVEHEGTVWAVDVGREAWRRWASGCRRQAGLFGPS